MKSLILFTATILAINFCQAQWEPDVRLTNDPADSWTSIPNAWCVAASGDTVHVVWYDNRDGNQEIYYKRSTDGGVTWGEDTRLTNKSADSWYPSIAVSGSVVHVAWDDDRDGNNEIYYKRSEDGGSTWGSDTRLTNNSANSYRPSLAISGSVVHIVWYDDRDGNWEIYYKRSTDGGLNWEPDMRLTNDPANSFNACVVVSGSFVHIVWTDYRDGNGEIYYKRSTDGGVSWGQDVRLTSDIFASTRACVATNDSVVNIVWDDNRDGNYEIYCKHSADGGMTWGADTRLTNDPNDSKAPNITVSGSVVHVVWSDNRDGNQRIYYKRSEDEGISWGNDTRLTNAFFDSQYPSIAVSGLFVHVVWYDNRDGNYEIYYERNPTGGFPVGIENDKINTATQQIIIFPNPASTRIHIKFNTEFNQPAGNKDEKYILTIRDIFGEELLSKQIQGGETVIDVSNLQNGIYFVEMTTGNKQTVCIKLSIQK